VRELENAIERAVVIGKGRQILPKDLPIFRPEYIQPAADPSLKAVEREHIIHILEKNDWNISQSAALLGIDRTTLYHKMKRYRIERP